MDSMTAKIGDLELLWDGREIEDGAASSDVTVKIVDGKMYAGQANDVEYIVDGNELADALHRLGFAGEA